MKAFNTYRHPTLGFEAVKVGFSWPALFFGLVWMLVKRLWKFAGLWLVAYAACSLIEGAAKNLLVGASQAIVQLLVIAAYFALWLVPPFNGNKWRDEDLAKRGYQPLKTVNADTPGAAIAQLANAPGTAVQMDAPREARP